MRDRDWRTSLRDSATLWLFGHDQPALAYAVWRSRVEGMRVLAGGQLGIKLIVASDEDLTTLAVATRSWTDTEMPGPLDLAFEHWLARGNWPVFAFEVPATASR
jgi:hypothetical protein